MSPEVLPLPRLCFRMSLFKYIFLRKHQIASPNEAERRRPEMGSAQHLAQCTTASWTYDIVVNLAGGCEHSSTLPGKRHSARLPWSFLACYCFYCLKHSCRLPLITVASHVAAAVAKALKSRRSMYCPAQCALQQAPCFHPWAQTAIN